MTNERSSLRLRRNEPELSHQERAQRYARQASEARQCGDRASAEKLQWLSFSQARIARQPETIRSCTGR